MFQFKTTWLSDFARKIKTSILIRMWQRREEPVPVLIEHKAAPVVPQVKKRIRSKKAEETSFGTWTNFSTILDELDDYRTCLQKVKKDDLEAYTLYSKIGAQVINTKSLVDMKELPASWRAGTHPAFGAAFVNMDDTASRTSVKFCYFQKMDRPSEVQPSNGSFYLVTYVYYAKTDKHKRRALVAELYVAVSERGDVIPLKSFVREDVPVVRRGRRRKGANSARVASVPVAQWRFPLLLRAIQEDNKDAGSLEDIAQRLFIFVACVYESSSDGLRVTAEKDGITAAFNVPMHRTAAFFKDRDKTVLQNGSTKRIFHITRTHKRVLADGSETFVKSHFRGERKFTWNGHKVSISLAGYHHNDLREFTETSIFVPDGEDNPPDTMTVETYAPLLAEHLRGDRRRLQ